MSKDPIGLFGGLNNSIYVSNPNQWVDPMGLAAEFLKKSNNESETAYYLKKALLHKDLKGKAPLN